MKILDRFFLLIFSLTIFTLSTGVAIVSLHLFSDDFLQNNLIYLYSQWETGVVALLIAIIALRLLLVSCKSAHSNKNFNAIVVVTELGQVNVTVAAIKNLLTKSIQAINGVRDIQVLVYADKPSKNMNESSRLNLKLKIVVGPDQIIPELTNKITQLVKERMQQIVGIDVMDVEVCIEDISNTVASKPRVV